MQIIIKNTSLATALTIVALSTSAAAAETQHTQKDFYFQLNTGGSYGTVPKGDFNDKSKSGWSPVYGLEAGYKFNENFRAGLDLSYRPDYALKNTNEVNDEGVKTVNNAKYKIKSMSTMVNIYYDIKNTHSFTPYLTAGMGIARNITKENEIAISSFGSKSKVSSASVKTTKNNFAYKFGLGTKYSLNQDFDLDVRYQYVNLGKIKANATYLTPTENGKLSSQEIMLGLAYKF
jgi:opacity protein-like surface antigen